MRESVLMFGKLLLCVCERMCGYELIGVRLMEEGSDAYGGGAKQT